jgi:hypothetical protein
MNITIITRADIHRLTLLLCTGQSVTSQNVVLPCAYQHVNLVQGHSCD